MKTYGYARVSTKRQAKDGNSLEAQESLLRENGATEIYRDVFTGTKAHRPQLDNLLREIQPGDKLVVTKLDRIARSAADGMELIEGLLNKGVTVHILNLGVLDTSTTGKLIRNIMLCFAEFERDIIVERMQEGREMARLNPEYKEGRKLKYTQKQIDHAMEMLETKSYNQVAETTGISRRTLIRYHNNLTRERVQGGQGVRGKSHRNRSVS